VSPAIIIVFHILFVTSRAWNYKESVQARWLVDLRWHLNILAALSDFLFNFVLLADEAVLKDVERGEYVVKAVSLLWDDDLGWGWMRIPTGYLLELWNFLMWNNDRTEGCLYFDKSEEDLENHIWIGDMAIHRTGKCSEIRRQRHYSSQKDCTDW